MDDSSYYLSLGGMQSLSRFIPKTRNLSRPSTHAFCTETRNKTDNVFYTCWCDLSDTVGPFVSEIDRRGDRATEGSSARLAVRSDTAKTLYRRYFSRFSNSGFFFASANRFGWPGGCKLGRKIEATVEIQRGRLGLWPLVRRNVVGGRLNWFDRSNDVIPLWILLRYDSWRGGREIEWKDL